MSKSGRVPSTEGWVVAKRGMTLWLADICLTLTILFTLVLGGLWVRSYFVLEGYMWADGRLRMVAVNAGRLSILLAGEKSDGQLRTPFGRWSQRASYNKNLPWRHYWWISRHEIPYYLDSTGQTKDVHLSVPLWMLMLAVGILPMLATIRLRRRALRHSRIRRGLCFACGYDLRASPEACPECGAERQWDRKAKSRP